MEARAREAADPLDRATVLVRGAITLVGEGSVPRVTLIGLHGGHDLLMRVRSAAAGAGVVIGAEPTGSGAYDVVVERDG
jgi:hypothetical protein